MGYGKAKPPATDHVCVCGRVSECVCGLRKSLSLSLDFWEWVNFAGWLGVWMNVCCLSWLNENEVNFLWHTKWTGGKWGRAEGDGGKRDCWITNDYVEHEYVRHCNLTMTGSHRVGNGRIDLSQISPLPTLFRRQVISKAIHLINLRRKQVFFMGQKSLSVYLPTQGLQGHNLHEICWHVLGSGVGIGEFGRGHAVKKI